MLQNRDSYTIRYLKMMALGIFVTVGGNQAIAADTNPPPRCQGFGSLQSISLTTWETGIGAWTVGTHDIDSPADFDTPDWAVVGSLPDSRPGKAAFVADQENGNCVDDLKTGALTLDSPSILIPAGTQVPRISVAHWFETDARWDGGNFKISINGGAYSLIPAFAIEVGPYNSTLYPALTEQGLTFNENPLAGQVAYTTDDNFLTGAWGESHINLLGIAEAGDTVKLRFDFGIDECGGAVGWYVDNVEFYSCSDEFIPSNTKLTLVKQVINDNNGDATASDWTLTASGPTPISGPGPSVTSGDGFAAGTYDLSESAGPGGYTASAWVCVGGTQNDADTVTLALDENATCTITNNDIQPTLKLVKTIINNDGGMVTDPDEFKLKVDGNIVLNNVSNGFDAGNYVVSEDGLPDYDSGTWGGDCNPNGSINLAVGMNAVCTITNDDIDLSDIIFRNGFE